jgi:hypothetical protein
LNGALNTNKRNVIAYFHCKDCQEYQNFQVQFIPLNESQNFNNIQKIAALLRDDCAFWVGKDAALTAMQENMISFKDPDTQDEQKVETYLYSLQCK